MTEIYLKSLHQYSRSQLSQLLMTEAMRQRGQLQFPAKKKFWKRTKLPCLHQSFQTTSPLNLLITLKFLFWGMGFLEAADNWLLATMKGQSAFAETIAQMGERAPVPTWKNASHSRICDEGRQAHVPKPTEYQHQGLGYGVPNALQEQGHLITLHKYIFMSFICTAMTACPCCKEKIFLFCVLGVPFFYPRDGLSGSIALTIRYFGSIYSNLFFYPRSFRIFIHLWID